MRSLFSILLLAISFSIYPNPAFAISEEKAIGFSSPASGRELTDFTLTDQDGRKFNIGMLEGKPLVVSLIYTGCSPACPTITTHLQNAFRAAGMDFGTKFRAITISFDVENDTPERMREYGRNFTSDFKKWIFASSDPQTIDKLTEELGFYYKKLATGFEHINMVTIVDPEGKIYKQVYGFDFKPEDILDPVYQSMNLSKAPQSRSLTLIDRVKLFCYRYDETTGRYRLDYGLLITLGISSLLQVATMSAIVYYVWVRRRSARPAS